MEGGGGREWGCFDDLHFDLLQLKHVCLSKKKQLSDLVSSDVQEGVTPRFGSKRAEGSLNPNPLAHCFYDCASTLITSERSPGHHYCF